MSSRPVVAGRACTYSAANEAATHGASTLATSREDAVRLVRGRPGCAATRQDRFSSARKSDRPSSPNYRLRSQCSSRPTQVEGGADDGAPGSETLQHPRNNDMGVRDWVREPLTACWYAALMPTRKAGSHPYRLGFRECVGSHRRSRWGAARVK